MPGDMLNFHVKPGAWLAGDQRVRQRARRATWPDRPWLQPWMTIRGESVEVDLFWRLAPEGVVRSVLIVPVEHDDQFCAHGFTPRGNHDPLQRFLDRAHGSFQNDGIVKAEFDMLAPGMTEASITDALDVG